MKRYFNKAQTSSRWLVLILTILCPFVGIYLMVDKHPDLLKSPKIRALTTTWFTIWFIGVAGLVFQPTRTPNTASSQPSSSISQGESHDETKTQETTSETDENTDQKQVQTEEKPSSTKAPAVPSDAQPQKPTTSSIMAGIAIKEAESVPYDRAKYQPNWNAGGGCDIRARILSSTSLISVQVGSNGCTVKYGSWNDPYTGQVLTGNPYRGDGTANDLDIDHIIPLNYVNSHGGYYWNDAQKRAYGSSITAMNSGVYLAVSASENRRKSDSGPSQYYPPNQAYRCDYSRKWRDTARTYAISLSSADYNLIANIITSCGGN
ncbi:MAG: hypothetical protein WAQ22_01850 [Candidatus Saccharimonas sp.]